VLCVDEKSQIQALNRTAPILPLRPGLPEKATHDYRRNGTTTLFAALEVATGKVTDQCYDRHGKAEFLDFLKKVAKAYPRRQAARGGGQLPHPQTRRDQRSGWPRTRASRCTSPRPRVLAQPRRGVLRDHHPTGHPPRHPSTASRNSSPRSGPFIDGWNDRCHPFTWTKTADEILPHATRKRTSDARH
jgi:hypothetical protein